MKSMKRIYFIVLFVSVAISGCSQKRTAPAELINQQASLPGNLPYDPFQWRVITSGLNNKEATMFTLYGNDAAVNYARTTGQHAYPADSVLCLVTWTRKEDKHWFGGEIPSEIKSIEFVKASAPPATGPTYTYESYAGAPPVKIEKDFATGADRANTILSMRASVMP